MTKKEEQFDTMDKRKILDVVHSERLKRLNLIIERQKKVISTLKRCCCIAVVMLIFTWLSVVAVFYTGKSPLMETSTLKPDLGSSYSMIAL